jgi:hypothetical protein
MKLFDEIERDSYEPAKYAEPIFDFLNRSARIESERVRRELEKWFSRYPLSKQIELFSRFRSDIDPHHQAAFFELFLHELLLKLGCSVSLHPPVPDADNTPDFLVESPNGEPFYMEATLATNESTEQAASRARMNIAYDVLNRRIDSPNFFIHLREQGAPTTPPNANKLASFVQNHISELDPDEIAGLYASGGITSVPRWYFEHDGWKIEILPIPKKPEVRGRPRVRPIGSRMIGFRQIDHRTAIRESITKKASKYGNLDLPYIVAVNTLDFVDEIDVMEALFGKEQFILEVPQDDPSSLESRMSRIPDGAWMGPEGARNTRISGLFLATRLSAWNIPRANLRLYHNPWAQKDYHSVLANLPRAYLKNESIEYLSGLSTGEIFHLPTSWPENANHLA